MSEQPKPCCDLSVQHTHGSLRADGTFTPDQPPVSAQTMVVRVEYDFSPPLNEFELRAFMSMLPPTPRRPHINPPDTATLIEHEEARERCTEQAEEIARLTATVEALIAESKRVVADRDAFWNRINALDIRSRTLQQVREMVEQEQRDWANYVGESDFVFNGLLAKLAALEGQP